MQVDGVDGGEEDVDGKQDEGKGEQVGEAEYGGEMGKGKGAME